MRSKSPKRFFVSFLLAILPIFSAMGAATVTPVAPYTTVTASSGEPGVYYASLILPTTPPNGFYVGNGYSQFDFNSTATDIRFTISGVSANLMIFAESSNGNSYYPVPIKSINGTVYANSTDVPYFSMNGGTYVIGINPLWICSATADGPNTRGCLNNTVHLGDTNADNIPDTSVPGFSLRFVDTTLTVPASVGGDDRADGTLLEIFPESMGPTLTHCPAAPGFLPADGAIIVNTGDFVVNVNTTTGGSPSFNGLKVVASTGALAGTDYLNATEFPNVAFGAGEQLIEGFENSTTENGGIYYNVDYGIQDTAGVIAFCGQNPGGVNQVGYPITNAFATDIKGFLSESNCFVATASFRNGRAPSVMMLRAFRDQVLSRFELGRDFIDWYYANGPIAAQWLIDHPAFRTVALSALIPLQAAAWIALHPSVLWIPFGALMLFLLAVFRRRGVLFMVFFTALSLAATSVHAETHQPYIDSLVSELPAESYQRTSENPDPYIQSLKRGIAPDETAGYSEELKKKVSPDGSKGYTKRIQRELPPDNRSAIDDFHKGRKLKPNKGDLTTASAFGFQIAASANRTYTAGANQDVAYEEVYGNGWIPDFKLHYEMRPFPRSSFFGKLGLYGSLGGSFTKANGIYDFNPDPSQFGDRSRTEFTFIMIPANIGLIYRMNWGVLWPYFGGGPSVIGMIEKRNDKQPSQRGYTFGTWFMGGIALGLDWLSPESSWHQYETATIKHSYLAIEYSYLTSLSGGLTEMTVDGIQVGFTFEL